MIQLRTYTNLIKGSAIYDALILLPLAVSPIFSGVNSSLQRMNEILGGNGWPVFLPLAVARFMQPGLMLGRIDGVARLVVAAILYATVYQNGLPILYLYAASELVVGVCLLALKVSRD